MGGMTAGRTQSIIRGREILILFPIHNDAMLMNTRREPRSHRAQM